MDASLLPVKFAKVKAASYSVDESAMAKKLSAGIVLYRTRETEIEVLIVHPGGPFWAKKDDGAWSIPKGEYVEGEDPLSVAKREFVEEIGSEITGVFMELPPAKQPSGKIIRAWAVEGDLDVASIRSNSFSMEWPPKSGRIQRFPEVDRALWCEIALARRKLLSGQRVLLDELEQQIRRGINNDGASRQIAATST